MPSPFATAEGNHLRSDGRLPRVVALVPVWEAAAFVEATLESLAQQSWPVFEILVSVDSSADHSEQICRAFSRRHPNMRVVAQEKRLGWIGNVNWLLGEAKGDYLLFAAHDDLLAPTYVERLVLALEVQPEAVLAFSDMEIAHRDGGIEVGRLVALENMHGAVARTARLLRLPANWHIPFRGLFRASAAARTGGLKHHFGGEFGADWPWLVRLASIGEFIRIPESLCRKRSMAGSLSSQWRYSARQWLGVTIACASEIRMSGLGRGAKAYLLSLLWLYYSIGVAGRLVRRAMRIPVYAKRLTVRMSSTAFQAGHKSRR